MNEIRIRALLARQYVPMRCIAGVAGLSGVCMVWEGLANCSLNLSVFHRKKIPHTDKPSADLTAEKPPLREAAPCKEKGFE